MEVKDPSLGSDLEKPSNGGELELDSSCSTPYVSAPSSPGRGPVPSYFFSAPASPMHYILSSIPSSIPYSSPPSEADVEASFSGAGSFEFEFSSRGSMISADELFLNGQIRPMRLASHLQRPQALAPLLDLEDDDDDDELRCPVASGARGRDLRLRSGSIHRRARSLSPLRNPRLPWTEDDDELERVPANRASDLETDPDPKQIEEPTPSSASASSSRSSSSGRNSKRWIFLKDLLYRSKSEGRENGKEKEKFWLSISFSPSKEKEKPKPSPAVSSPAPAAKRAAPGSARRPSAHERHYTAKRAQAEEMRRRTFLPYRQGLLGCLGISSRGYGAVSGLAKTLNPLSSR